MKALQQLLIALTLLAGSPAWAVQPDEVLADQTLEAQARPRFNWRTALLWLGPPGALLGGALALFLLGRRRARPALAGREGEALTAAEEARLARLIQAGDR